MAIVRHGEAVKDLALKIKLERRLVTKIRPLFREINRNAKNYFELENKIPDVIKDHKIELEVLLRNHYKRVAKDFKNRLRLSVEKSIQKKYIEIKSTSTLEKAISDYIVFRANTQSEYILDTTQKELNNAYTSSVFDETIQTREEFIKEASFQADRKALGRAGNIGLTETQNMAESSKFLEAKYIFSEDQLVVGGVPITTENSEIFKTWTAFLTEVTREWHADADDQTVLQSDPFVVGGEYLMFPGDMSLGATLKNICNCRCNTSRAIEFSGLPSHVYRPDPAIYNPEA